MTAPATATKKRRSPRKAPIPTLRQLNARPKFQRLFRDGLWIVEVPLCGLYGEGRVMTLDEDVWTHVQPLFGREWCLVPTRYKGRKPIAFSVRTSRKEALDNSIRAHWPSGAITLARWIKAATRPDQHVHFLNGDTTDLRRANLEVRAAPWMREQVAGPTAAGAVL